MKTTLTLVGMTSFVPVIVIATILLVIMPKDPSTLMPASLAATSLISGGIVLVLMFDIPSAVTQKNLRKMIYPIYATTAVALVTQTVAYCNLYYHSGGDVDPTAYLQRKTSYTGGYYYSVKKTTYREYLVSDKSFLEHPFSDHTILSHVDSIAKIENYPINVNLKFPTEGRDYKVTMTLQGGCIHLPFNDEKLHVLFQDNKDSQKVDIAHLAAAELKKLTDSIFENIPIPPADCYVLVPVPVEKNVLGYLTEKYGMALVKHPNKTMRLYIKIECQHPSSNYRLFSTEEVVASN